MERDQRRGSFWTSLPGILTAIAGMITGTAAIVTATVTLSRTPAPTPTTTPTVTAPAPATPNPTTSTTTRSPTPTTPAPETAAIEVVYSGDPYSCTLVLQVTIAEVTATQQEVRQTIRDLPVGVQDYKISGQITCPTLGTCNATGEGKVTVQDGREYALVWVNNDIAECTVTLAQ